MNNLSASEKYKLFMEITNNSFVELSLTYAKSYQENPKAFLSCYKKHKGIKAVCNWIVFTYKYIGAFEEIEAQGVDFSNWVNKQDIEEKDKKGLNQILMIIHSILKK